MKEVSVWAPLASRVRVRVAEAGGIDGPGASTAALEAAGGGWFSGKVAPARADADYGFLLDDDPTLLADPRSRRQPEGVHGPSRLTGDVFPWTDGGWRGRALLGSVFYELHIGTFTPGGTFATAIDRLDHLVALGVTHVELLPVNDFNGPRNWGYDGVLWYAVHEAYGGPDGLKLLVDACHNRGLAVTLDVVYNHLGPSGNVLPRFGPYTREGRNTWGDLINLDGEGSRSVREFIIHNAMMWFAEFHVDALRLDAVHALHDRSEPHLLAELSCRVDELSASLGRPLTLIAESDLNDPVMITPRDEGGYGLAGQWDDDVHHALHAAITGERQGYYVDFGSLAAVAKVFTGAFLHDGTYSTFRGAVHGKPVDRHRTSGHRFIVCLQNHDQVGNRAAGERLPRLASFGLVKVAAVLLLTSPFTPLLWMGEEWAASTPWPFFTSHSEPELAEATREGRVAEFADHGWDPDQVPDPQDPATFASAILRWDERTNSSHRSVLRLYGRLLRLRHRYPDLADPRLDRVEAEFDEAERWIRITRGSYRVIANLSSVPRLVPVREPEVTVVLTTDPGPRMEGEGIVVPPESAVILRVHVAE